MRGIVVAPVVSGLILGASTILDLCILLHTLTFPTMLLLRRLWVSGLKLSLVRGAPSLRYPLFSTSLTSQIINTLRLTLKIKGGLALVSLPQDEGC